ncbi:MAG: hypothetical protein HY432_03365, partial [Candidatus Liptonbacteria bacterium]|nr:hypothetical protein [Candidatus Liptonbacteria bacterium]
PWKSDEEVPGYEPEEEKENPKMKTWAIAGVSVFVIVAAAAGYYYFTRPSGASVGIEFSKPDRILAGQPFSLKITFSNYSDEVLKNAVLSAYLPDDVFYLAGTPNQRVIEKNVGDVGPGSVNPDDFTLIAVGDSQVLKRIQAKLSYQLGGSTAEFETESKIDLSIGQQAVDLNFELPQAVFSGSNFNIEVKYQNNSDKDFSNDVILKMDYPSGFKFAKGSTEVSSGNNQWNLGKLQKGAGGSITITGSLVGADGVSSGFHGAVSTSFGGRSFTIAEQTANLSISSSPLSISLSANGSSDYIAHAGDEIVYNLRYKNNSSMTFENIIIKASLSGAMLDFSTLKTDAAFDPLRNTFTWMVANAPGLSQLSPGEEGVFSIDIRLKKDFPIKRISDKNYAVKLDSEISSPTVPQGTDAERTVSTVGIETKIAGKVQVQAKALWRDAASDILNKGPYPPRVNQTTQYAIHWIVKNYATDVSGVKVSGFLQSGARWTGVVKSNTGGKPSYNSSTGEVTWNVGDMIATKGVISQPAEAIFQIEVTPAINQVGQFITFLGNTIVKWHDNFVNADFNDSFPSLNTMLPDDTTISPSADRTVQK